jgi:catechol 2,3-dioxygenase-like lactoylglutathione lyase family enzyme
MARLASMVRPRDYRGDKREKAMAVFNHAGHVVADPRRSIRFYQEVLGFRYWYEVSPPDQGVGKLCGLPPPLDVTAYYLKLDGFVLELMHYAASGAAAPYRPRTMNEPGLTHLSISVPDIRAAARKAVEYGGAIIEESDLGIALMIRDPDGQLIELLGMDFPASRPPMPD